MEKRAATPETTCDDQKKQNAGRARECGGKKERKKALNRRHEGKRDERGERNEYDDCKIITEKVPSKQTRLKKRQSGRNIKEYSGYAQSEKRKTEETVSRDRYEQMQCAL